MGEKIIMNAPIILTEGTYSEHDLNTFKNTHNIWEYKDIYISQQQELFQIAHPSISGTDKYKKELDAISQRSESTRGNYVYFPWSGLLLHMVDKHDLTRLRTNRTRNLITEKEQKILEKFTAGVAGLSFGNGIALALVYSGIANSIKIADRDIFETTNLNRVRVGLPSVGEQKTKITAREIYEINPYADIRIFTDGLTEKNLPDFVGQKPKLHIIFDVVDDFAMKVRIRFAARKAKIPVLMLTSLEDSVLVDIERFDLDNTVEIFHGLLGGVTDDLLTKKMTEADKANYAMKIVGPERVSYRNLLSLSNIGQTLVSRPHLYGTVSIVCGLAAYITKRIALNEDIPSLRQLITFNEIVGIAAHHDDTSLARSGLLSKLMSRSI
jgi:tRNA A37 threonylcarbamoyladenosine dehydratase